MQVEIWSDIACPWCYIGKRHFESALAQFDHSDEVEIVWRSFELDPAAPASYGISIDELLSRKYGVTLARAGEMNEHLTRVAALDGLSFQTSIMKPGSTFDAHRLTHFAGTHGLRNEMTERLMKAYLEEGVQMSDREELVRLAVETGLDAAKTAAVLADDAFADFVRQDEARAEEFDIRGVPFFAIDERYGISGAQPAATFLQALQAAWNERTLAVPAGERCDDESCAVHH